MSQSLPLAETIKGRASSESSSKSSSTQSPRVPKEMSQNESQDEKSKPSPAVTKGPDPKVDKKVSKTKGSQSKSEGHSSKKKGGECSSNTPIEGSYPVLIQQHKRSEKSKKGKGKSAPTSQQNSQNQECQQQVEVKGFPADITKDDLSLFFLSMYPIHSVTKTIDPQDKSTAIATVTFINQDDYESFLSRDLILYDDTELIICPRSSNKDKTVNENSAAGIDMVPESVLQLTGIGQDISFQELKDIFSRYAKISFVDVNYDTKTGYVRFKEAHTARGVLQQLFNNGLSTICVKSSVLQADVLTGREEEQYWLNVKTAKDDMKEERKGKKETREKRRMKAEQETLKSQKSTETKGEKRPTSGGRERLISGGGERPMSGGRKRTDSGGGERAMSGGRKRTDSGGRERPMSGGRERTDNQDSKPSRNKDRPASGRKSDRGSQPPNRQSSGNQSRTGNHRGHRDRRKDQQKQVIFEPYWPIDAVSDGLKRGDLLQGPIRINPRNYEECYIPHPNGVSDIFVSGLKHRNRAMNGDIVAVKLCDQDLWRVNEDYVKSMEDAAKGDNKVDPISDGVTDDSALTNARIKNESKETEKSDDDSSDPDVIVEEEEEVILEKKVKKHDKSVEILVGNLSAISVQDGGVSGETEGSRVCNGKMLENVNQVQNTQNKCESQKNVKESGTPVKDDSKKKNNQQQTPKKKYVSVDDMMRSGSPTVKGLFLDGKMEESRAANRMIQRTAKVVAIIEPKHSRASTGHIKPMSDGNKNVALFCPTDSRVPRIIIPVSDCPKDFLERPGDHANTLFICRLMEWRENSMMAHGFPVFSGERCGPMGLLFKDKKGFLGDAIFEQTPIRNLKRSLGEAGQIEPETEGMLIENDVDYSEFSEEAINSLPIQNLPWTIPAEEYDKRRDFRKQCVFTIDPSTARDLDDALSIEVIEDDLYEVGVHIADVSYFLQEGTALDKVAGNRATSVYLVQKVIPMLPRILCEQLCSLNPDEDRLTFSVTWQMNSAGEIFEEWFGRSIIKSCCKLSYDHAQGFIEDPDKDWGVDELPPISEGFTVNDIKTRVLNLNKIAVNLRKGRFDNGALRLDQVKLQFSLDKETMMPNGYSVYQQRDSNRLVEEFMLLANMAVAHKIYKTYPEKAMLRRHPPPQTRMADELSDLCENLGVPIDISSAGSLQSSLWRYLGEDEYSKARMQVLVSMCSKPMQNAKYFCTGCLDDEELFRHYALSVPLYTHFTSPIRRYADVIVHRLLAAALGYCMETEKSKYLIQGQADICNDKKTNSKRVQDLSAELFFAVFVKEAGPFEEKAMVMGVLDKAFDIFVLKLGVTKRVYCDKLDLKEKIFVKEQKLPVLTLVWNPSGDNTDVVTQRITIFTVVNCIIKAGELPLQWMATIKHPQAGKET